MDTRPVPAAQPRYRIQGSAAQEIHAPIDVVWALVTDVERMGDWSPETYRAEWLGGATGPAVGARFRGYNRRPYLQRWSTRPRVTVCETPRKFAFALGTRHHHFVVWRYDLRPSGNGTRITESVTVRGYALYGLLRPRRRERQLIEGMQTTLARLKQAAEGDLEPDVDVALPREVRLPRGPGA